MYTTEVRAQEQAICHLFFHCCMKDGVFNDAELTEVSSRMVEVGLYKQLDFKEEVLRYQSYKTSVINDTDYLEYLIKLITPVNTLALYSYCVELVLSDSTMSPEEESLLGRIARILDINAQEQATTKKLLAQRKVVKTEKII
ncbi:MAG TPA: TerB family tellurite resistance protein [Flavitalea sp.]|nr:TerB family tellurite resistance protein [Flavitalea sp.]